MMSNVSLLRKSQFIKHTECAQCGSSDANGLFDDDHQYCFACNAYVQGNDITADYVEQFKKNKPTMKEFKEYVDITYCSIPARNITQSTCVSYDVKATDDKHYYPYTNENGEIVAVKIRGVKDKSFRTDGEFKEGLLFGQSKFSGGGKYVTIVEGELDALSAFQMMGSKYPVVSIKTGAASALRDCKDNYEWLNSFEHIVVCFDQDEPGLKASKEVAELFGNKVSIVKHKAGFKDASDYLQSNQSKDFTDVWWNAEQYVPDGIISAQVLLEDLKKPLTKAPVLYPWEGLNKMLYGLRTSELVVLAAGSGLGKSTIVRELVSNILNKTEEKVGLAFLEETPERTMRGLVGLEMAKKIHLPDAIYDPEEVERVYDRLDLKNRVFLWEHFGSNDIVNVLNRLRYFVKVLGCKWLVLDHLSILVSDQAGGDERKNIDMVMTKLRTFVQEVNCGLLLVSHLKRAEGKSLEDGAVTSLGMLRGSGSIGQLADAVIGAERNSQAPDIRERNTTHVRVLKSRYTGYTGPACSLFYDDATGRLQEIRDVL